MSVEPEGQNGAPEDQAPPAEENKLFVGGISWHMQDRELKDSAPFPMGPLAVLLLMLNPPFQEGCVFCSLPQIWTL